MLDSPGLISQNIHDFPSRAFSMSNYVNEEESTGKE
jgi:hypothetical protein